MNRFKIGQEIVCIHDKNNSPICDFKFKKGQIYTVIEVGIDFMFGPYVRVKGQPIDEAAFEKYFEPIKYDDCTKELAEIMVKHLGGVKKEKLEHINI